MTDQKQKRFQQSASTGLLITFLTQLAKASDFRTINYAELSEAGHCECQREGRGYLNRAILRVFRDHRKLFICINGVGFKLATDAEVSALGGTTLRHLHRSARRTREKMTVSNLDSLTNAQRLNHLAADALLGLQEQATRPIVQKRLEATFEKTGPKSMEAEELLKMAGVKQIS